MSLHSSLATVQVLEPETTATPAVIDLLPAEVHARLQANAAVIVDVREASEYENERIPGAFLMPLSFFEAEAFPALPGIEVVLMCAVGKRSAAAGKQLLKAGFSRVQHMQGGLNAWKDAGFPFEQD